MYISGEDAVERLVGRGLLDPNNLPSDAEVDDLLAQVHSIMDAWLNWHVARRQYSERLQSGSSGAFRASNLPILKVISVQTVPTEDDEQPEDMGYRWDGSDAYIYADYNLADTPADVVYEAGLDPLPAVFKIAALRVLLKAMEFADGDVYEADFSWVNSNQQEVRSLTLPGSVKREFFQSSNPSDAGSGVGGSATELDKMFSGLLHQYRRTLFFA